MNEQEVLSLLETKLNTGKYSFKTILIAVVISLILGSVLGAYITKVHFPTSNTEVKVVKDTNTVLIKGDTVTKTDLQYVKGETVYLPAITSGSSEGLAPVSKGTPGAIETKLDGKFTFDKPDFVYMVNGKVGKFTRTDNEKALFEKNMMDLRQTSTITIQAEIPTIDLTRHDVLTIGTMISNGKFDPAAGYTHSMNKVSAYQLAISKNANYIGAGIKF